ncbi:Crp/Fnr family transcriptional regulator [Actinacidiphila oryziradicis]|uniref:Cyclic nucleotide-binding domain-containing protein n=1 Tax=Actinacidiphila oryziradicis TaxID=2571141 RepID=A0A4U0T7P7_9ACTN|nr:cyclic nucleotide-binding domain-containing protein [Actinacidiphila oryziradicis]TKA09455.1 cyclic nucleotide-binding domain-containing protein [Actinacidiphila oryziradicis]
MTTTTNSLGALPPDSRERLMKLAREVSFPAGTRVFEEGSRADRFWIIQSGSVTLDLHVPGRRAAAVGTLGPGDLLGWSWLFPPYSWHLGAEAHVQVRAMEFDATLVRALCEADPVLGRAMFRSVGEIVASRLQSARTRLLDLYGPYGSGPRL